MSENYYQKLERESVEELKTLLARPIAPNKEWVGDIDESTNQSKYFDPWDIFPIYGNYSSEFDEMALTVLKNLMGSNRHEETLAHELFREMLCVKGLCDYGTSPRVCFATTGFKELLPQFIEKWEQYYKLVWIEENK